MTMSDALERIWTQPDRKGYCITGVWPYRPSEQRNMIEYTRSDVALAMVAAALEPWVTLRSESHGAVGYHLNGDAADWDEFDLPETPADAHAALELIRQEERELTVKSCTHYCTDCNNVVPLGDDGRGACGHGRIYDVRPEAIERVKREARNEARREAAGVLTDETELSRLARNAILALMEDTAEHRAKAAEAKLAKAVEALESGEHLIAGELTGADWKRGCMEFLKEARATLAELKGQDDEHP